jgi:hypothetical protein
MRKQGSKAQGKLGYGHVKELLREALPPIEEDISMQVNLWPSVESKMRAPTAPETGKLHVPWFDWALGFGLAALLALFPAWIPVLLYCL